MNQENLCRKENVIIYYNSRYSNLKTVSIVESRTMGS